MNSTQIFSIAFMFVSIFSFSQDLVQTQTLTSSGSMSLAFDRSDKSIKGTPYIIDNFTPARVSADQDKIFNLRYNAVTDQMEVQSDKNTIQAINKNIEGVTITFLKDDKTYESFNYLDKDGVALRGYFIHVNSANSKIKLLIKESKKFIDRKPAKSGYQDTKPAHFKRVDDTYYVMVKNKTAQIVPSKKKDIINLFPDHTESVSIYLKNNKFKTSKPDDLLKLINHVNTL